MSTTLTTPARLAALAALALTSACLQAEEIDPMMKQAKYKAYAPNPMFADGRAMRTPPANTISREKRLGSTELLAGVDASGKTIIGFPFPLTPEHLETGRAKYAIHCAVCHGLAGDSKGLVSNQMALRAPPSLHEKVALTNGHIYEVIANGFGLMGGYAPDLTVEERWAVVGYVRALQTTRLGQLEDAPPAVRAGLAKETP